jgi:hypothetical protein
MAIQRRTFLIFAVIGTILLALSAGWIAWRMSTGQPIIPGGSSAAQCIGGETGPFAGCPLNFSSNSGESCAQAAIRMGCYNTGTGECPGDDYITYICPLDTAEEVEAAERGTTNCNQGAQNGLHPPGSGFCGYWQADCQSNPGAFKGGYSTQGCDEPSGSSSSSSSSSSGGAPACGSPCTTNDQCQGEGMINPICLDNGTCYDAQACGDGSSSGDDGEGKATCRSFDDQQGDGGSKTFVVNEGESLTTTLYTQVLKEDGGKVQNYNYKILTPGIGTTTPSGTTSRSSTVWTITGAQTEALGPGTYKAISVKVKDTTGRVTGGNTRCSVTLTILDSVITEDEPAWVLTKAGSEVCATSGNSSTVEYTIVLKNVGDVEGTIGEVVDSLDSSITADMIDDIVPSEGDFNDTTNEITWDGGGAGYTLDPEEELEFTYTVTFDDSQFDTYDNTVSASPSDGSVAPTDASATVDVDCEEDELPETALEPDQVVTLLAVLGAVIFMFLASLEIKYGVVSKALRLNYVDGLTEGEFQETVYKKAKRAKK